MSSNLNVLYSAAGLPALISTGITFIYFFLKVCRYVFDAISHQTEGRVATAMSGCGKQEHSPDTGKESHPEVCQQILGNPTEQYGRGPQDPQGPFFYQEGGKTYASIPMGMLQNIQKIPLFEKMQKDCKAEGIELPKNIMAKNLITHVLTPQEYLWNVEAGTMPPMNNHSVMKKMAENATAHDQPKFLMMEFWDFKHPIPPKTPQPQKHK